MTTRPKRETAQLVRTQLSRRSHRTLARNDLTMATTVPHPETDAIGDSPDAHSEKSDGYRPHIHWSDMSWDERRLPGMATIHLQHVDRALQSMGAISEVLTRAFHAQCDESGELDGAILSATTQEGLHLALHCLWTQATITMAELRNDERECWGKAVRR